MKTAEDMVRDERRDLLGLIQRFATLNAPAGEFFTLASGERTELYIDIKRASMHRAVQRRLAIHLHDALLDFGFIDAVAGVALGGCQLASITASYAAELEERRMSSPQLDVLFIRKERSTHGLGNIVEGPVLREMRVVLLEDVVTTGESSMRAVRHLRDVGCEVRGVLAVIDRRRERPDVLEDQTKIRSLFTFDELLYGEGVGS